jgi:pimeloyl-ACP methyl ester carboxylesterase
MTQQLVYLHGVPGSSLELSLATDFLVLQSNIFAPDRISDSPALDFQSYCDRLAKQIVDAFPEGPISLVGFSLGALTTVEMAIRLADRVEAIDLIAPAAPLACGVDLDKMAGGPVFRLARNSPRIFAALNAVQSWFARLAPKLLTRLLFANAKGGDAILAENPAFIACIAEIVKSTYANIGGYTREVRAYVTLWEDSVPQVGARVTLWHGEVDNWAPVEMSEWLSEHLPNVTRFHRLPDLSHYSTLIHALDAIARR